MNAMENTSASLLDRLLAFLARKMRENALPLASSFITGLLAYMYCFTNKFETMDDLACFFTTGGSLVRGRWGLKLSELVFPMCSVPWLNGILSLCLLSVAVCFVIRMFRITEPLLVILLSALLISFPTQVCTFGYMYTAPQYALALLLAMAAVKTAAENETKSSFLKAFVLLVFSLGIYQAYVGAAASLLIVFCFSLCLEDVPGQKILKKGLGFVALLLLSMAVYYAVNVVANAVMDIEMGSYAEESLNGIGDLLYGLRVAYTAFIGYFTKGYYDLIPTPASRVFHLFALVVVFLLLVLHFSSTKHRSEGRLTIALLCLLLLPLGINCIRVISTLFHNLMLYGFTSLYVLSAVVLERCTKNVSVRQKKVFKDMLALAMAAVAAINISYANRVFIKLFMQFEQAESVYTNVLSQLTADPEFNQDSVIAVVGTNRYLDMIPIDTDRIAGMCEGIVGTYSQAEFLRYYLGVNLNLAGWDVTDTLEGREEIEQMPAYPYYGCIQKIDGYYVLKLH